MRSIEHLRAHVDFEYAVKRYFSFLLDLGYKEVESLPTIVRYQKHQIDVDIYHGRQSYEIDFGITFLDNRYTLSDCISFSDEQEGEKYRIPAATTKEAVENSLEKISLLVVKYCNRALAGDESYFSELENKKKLWMEKYWFDLNVRHVRPRANEAFQLGEYKKAVELYKAIESALTPAERKKLQIAERESKSGSV